MESMSLKHCQILIQTRSLSAFSLSEPGSFSTIMLPHCSIILISFHRGGGSGAYGMEDTLQSGNLLTESITHMWQHVLSWEDSRGRERERGASVSLTSPVMISVCVRPSSEPPSFLWLNVLESYTASRCFYIPASATVHPTHPTHPAVWAQAKCGILNSSASLIHWRRLNLTDHSYLERNDNSSDEAVDKDGGGTGGLRDGWRWLMFSRWSGRGY